jgi:peptide/nickel transport system substrate-binding protein
MRTTYRFRPNLTWHDGTPFAAADYVFGWRVYASPDVGLSRQPPFDAIEQIEAPDSRTLVIHWQRPYPDAAHMAGRDQGLPALPRHPLEAAFASESAESFLALPYWTREHVGLGPYKEKAWEPGSHIEAVAFDGHVTGRPKIDRIKLVFIPDANTALANLLSGEVHFATPTVVGLQQAMTLAQEWGPRNAGTVINQYRTWHGVYFQFRPAFTNPRSLLDVRVRKALAHTVDKQTINDTIHAGLAVDANFWRPPNGQWGAAVERGAVKHGYDLRRSEQLMREAGFEKRADGIYSSPSEGRFAVEVRSGGGAALVAVLANDWQKAGFEIEQKVVPFGQALDVETRSSYPGMELTVNRANERTAVSPNPGNNTNPENQWRGGSQTSWTHPAYTELVGRFTATLDRGERAELLAQMARIFAEDLGAISLAFPPSHSVVVSAIRGPRTVAPEAIIFWNVHEWEMSSVVP